MKYRVVLVDTRQPEVVQLLTLLQKACLPYDKIYPITQGYWHVVYAQNGEAVGFGGIVPSTRWSDTNVAQALYQLIKDRDSRSGLSDSVLKWPKD